MFIIGNISVVADDAGLWKSVNRDLLLFYYYGILDCVQARGEGELTVSFYTGCITFVR